MFGTMVALSADGNTALIGAWNDDNVLPGNDHYSGKGAAWVFTRSGSAWTQQGEKLVGDCTSGCANEGTGETGEGKFATSVALSEDGDTAMIGGWDDDSGRGAVWAFTRSDSTWIQQGEKLVGDCTGSCVNEGTGETGEGRFGVTVALSADGNTALIGGLDDNGTRGAVWVFTRSGSAWTQQGEKLTGGGEAGEGEFGTNVALSADGGTGMIGAWRDNGGRGAAWVFANQPSAATGSASAVTRSAATLNATVNPEGEAVSECRFEYGATTAYGASVPCASAPGAGTAPVAVSAAIASLLANDQLPLPGCGGQPRRGQLRRRSDVHDRSPRRNLHDRSDYHPVCPAHLPVAAGTQRDVPASCGAARRPIHGEMAWGQSARPHQPREDAHWNDLLVLAQRVGDRDLQLRPARQRPRG